MKAFLKKWWLTLLLFTCAVVLCLVSVILLLIQHRNQVLLQQTMDALGTAPLQTLEENFDAPDLHVEEAADTVSDNETLAPIEPYISPYQNYFDENEDMIGWLRIPDTLIDYPVMQTPFDENYYLEKGFDKQPNANGSLIMDTDSDVATPGTNLIIHGHNMKSGEMFGSLQNYEKEAYFIEHPLVSLFVENEERTYQICSVFYSQVYKKTDTVFKYYQFFEATTEEDFDNFYENIKKLSLYDTQVTASYGDCFLTLSTCSYQVARGRFVVVAKQID